MQASLIPLQKCSNFFIQKSKLCSLTGYLLSQTDITNSVSTSLLYKKIRTGPGQPWEFMVSPMNPRTDVQMSLTWLTLSRNGCLSRNILPVSLAFLQKLIPFWLWQRRDLPAYILNLQKQMENSKIQILLLKNLSHLLFVENDLCISTLLGNFFKVFILGKFLNAIGAHNIGRCSL